MSAYHIDTRESELSGRISPFPLAIIPDVTSTRTIYLSTSHITRAPLDGELYRSRDYGNVWDIYALGVGVFFFVIPQCNGGIPFSSTYEKERVNIS